MFWTRIARGIFRVGQELASLLLAEAAAVDQLEIVDIDAFLLDRGGVRRHRAGRDAADVGMVSARGDPEQDPLPIPPPLAGEGGEGASNTGVHTVMSGRCVPPL